MTPVGGAQAVGSTAGAAGLPSTLPQAVWTARRRSLPRLPSHLMPSAPCCSPITVPRSHRSSVDISVGGTTQGTAAAALDAAAVQRCGHLGPLSQPWLPAGAGSRGRLPGGGHLGPLSQPWLLGRADAVTTLREALLPIASTVPLTRSARHGISLRVATPASSPSACHSQSLHADWCRLVPRGVEPAHRGGA